MFLDYHNILWYYHHVIIFCAPPTQAFQSISESHTLLSLYLKSAIPLCHRAVVCWLFFYYWGSCSHCENDTGLAIGRRKYPKRIGMSFSLFLFAQMPKGFGIYLKGGIHMSRKNNHSTRRYRYRGGDRRRQKLRKTEQKAAKYRRSYTRVVPHQMGQRRA